MKMIAKKDGRLLGLLEAEFGSASRTRIRKMIQFKMVKVSGVPVTRVDHPVKAGEAIEYIKLRGQHKRLPAPVPILYEDDYLMVVEKPPGLLTYGEKGTGGSSLYKRLIEYRKEVSGTGYRLYVVHRIDREVSGIVMFAKSANFQEQLKAKWKETKKYYYALVEGKPEKASGTVKSLLKEGKDRKVYSVTAPEIGKVAITHYRTLRALPHHTLLEVRLETGRKNQIRVQLSELGCPVVGDQRYGASDDVKRRIRLHAFRIGFTHPVTGKLLEIESPMPTGFLVLKSRDEKYK
jgi:23S rRNA pseudouridine1911/1915/1917 synthase